MELGSSRWTLIDFHSVLRRYLLTEIAQPFPVASAVLPICVQGSGTEEGPIPRVRLTKSAIDNLPVLTKDTVYWDAGLPGFGVKVTPRGRKVFQVMYRLAGAGSRCFSKIS
jgi:hypothetical protein